MGSYVTKRAPSVGIIRTGAKGLSQPDHPDPVPLR